MDRRPTSICVLGPGRTGTSLTVRLLGLAGVYLGPDRELLSRSGIPANPKGFWEHRGLSRINQRVLRRLGGSWSEPPPLPSGWERSPELDAERDDARVLLERSFGGRPLWAWKDSRNSLTLPFWQPLLSAIGVDVRYVICVRNPLDVAASLSAPRPLSRSEAVSLWARYLASALVGTAARPRLLVAYEDYFASWQDSVARLLGFAGVAQPPPGSAAAQAMREFADERLWRHRGGRATVTSDSAVGGEAARLYDLATRLAAGESAPALVVEADSCARHLLLTAAEASAG